jgi:glycerol-3-phosphate cytidylyltransferase
MKKKIIGYTTGVFDLFHVGHVEILKKSKSLCSKLIVGVTSDNLVRYKHKKAIIPFKERIKVVSSCKYVDLAVPQNNMNKILAYKKYKFDVMFVGDDWYNTKKWREIEEDFKKLDVKIIYFPYTKTTSSTKINITLNKLRNKKI